MELGPSTALAGALEGLLIADRAGVFTYANPAAEKILGLPSTEIVNRSAQSWKTAGIDGRPFPVDELPVVRLLRTGEPEWRAEHAFERTDGSQAILSHTARLIRNEFGGVEGAVVSLVDVTDWRHAAERARKAESAFFAFVERSPNGIALHRQGRLVYANPSLCQTLGYESHEVVGRLVLDFVHPADRPAVRERLRLLDEEGRDVPVLEERMLHRDGRVIDVEVSAIPVVFEDQPTTLVIVVDVSETKRVRAELDRSVSLLRATLESTADGILVVDAQGRITTFNEKFLEMWRIPRSIIEQRNDDLAISYVLSQLEDASSFVARTRELYASPEVASHDLIELTDGRRFSRYSQPQRIDGKCVGRVWSFLDVTEFTQAKAERERLLAEMRLRHDLVQTVIDHAPIGLALMRGPDLAYELVNEHFRWAFGEPHGLSGPLGELAPSAAAEQRPILERVLATGEPYRAADVPFLVRRAPGGRIEEAHFGLQYSRVPTPKGDAVLALAVETTEQVAARRRIEALAAVAQRQAAELESIHASMADGVIVCDATGRITLINEAAVRLSGVARAEVLDQPLEVLARLLDLREVDGTPVLASSLPLARALAGETVTSAPLWSERTGKRVYVRTKATPLHNEKGAVVGAVAVDRDVTEMIDFDLSKDQFVRIAAHELKTPIAIMKGYAQLLLRSADKFPAAMAGSLAAIERGATRIERLVNDLLDLSQLQLGRLEMRHEKIDLPELVEAVARRMALTTKKHNIRVTEAEPVVIHGDRARLEQVLVNLLDNAIRYSPRGGDVEITLVVKERGAEVSVRDQGVGIPLEKQGPVFQCFYRPHTGTPYDYGGMGVGLYISREIVARHGGRMWFESQEGSGSVFSFRLPV